MRTVQALNLAAGQDATLKQVAAQLGVDKGATSRRVQQAIAGGYLHDLEHRKGLPARIVLGHRLPAGKEVLPDPVSLLVAWRQAANPPTMG